MSKTIKRKQGGKREGSGRKPLPEKKEPLTLYLYPSVITRNGGRIGCRQKIEGFLAKNN